MRTRAEIVESLIVERYDPDRSAWIRSARESFEADRQSEAEKLLAELEVSADELERKRARGRLAELCEELNIPLEGVE